MNKDFLYPASFLVKQTKKGIYSSTYPVAMPYIGNPSYDDAIHKWKFWHPETKLLYTPQEYLSYKVSGGNQSYYQFLKAHLLEIDVAGTEENPFDKHSFAALPLTFAQNSLGVNHSFSEWDYGVFLERTKYYHSKLIFFGTHDRVLKYSEKIIGEYLDWWIESEKMNLQKYEEYREKLEAEEDYYSDPSKESDSWMDDPENYWNID